MKKYKNKIDGLSKSVVHDILAKTVEEDKIKDGPYQMNIPQEIVMTELQSNYYLT